MLKEKDKYKFGVDKRIFKKTNNKHISKLIVVKFIPIWIEFQVFFSLN